MGMLTLPRDRLGFTVFGTVLDTKLLSWLFTGMMTVLMTVQFHESLIIMALSSDDDDDRKDCGLTDEGEAAFQTTASLLNASCTFNITVGPGGVFEH